ncbi:MAG: protein kinase [Gemmatimonadetes bacterium]|nr:protein kinase [Gemmatimonadota bacterium]
MLNRTLAHYEIIEKLGEGGMGEVYRARDQKLGRDVALKVLSPELARDAERRHRFEREARAVAALNHPNIVTLYSIEEAEGVHFLTMEHVEGQTLSSSIVPGGMELADFFRIAIPLADALSAAHAKGIAHRDLKPANVMFDARGHVKILDFGLAKLLDSGSEAEETMVAGPDDMTGEGRIVGTVAYMSPEQAEGREIDARSDVFSLGIVLYEMATGARPFRGKTNISTISAILKDEPAPVTELRPVAPRHLGRIIARCLAKDPDRRYQTAIDVRNELEGLKDETDSDSRLHSQTGLPAQASAPGAASPASTGAGALENEVLSWSSSPDSGEEGRLSPSTLAAIAQDLTGKDSETGSSPTMIAGFHIPGRVAALVIGVIAAALVVFFMLRGGDDGEPGVTSTLDPPKTPATQGAGGGAGVADSRAAEERRRIVVLPFENLGSADDAYFAAGITEEITSRLARVGDLSVISRTTAVQYDRTGKTMSRIGEELDVDYVLEGTVRWEKRADATSRVRVTPQLIKTADDTHVWSNSYDRSMDEIFRVQSEIAEEVVGKLDVTLRSTDRVAIEEQLTDNIEAWHAYRRGMAITKESDFDNPATWELAVDMFQRAVTLDPAFHRAWVELAIAHAAFNHWQWDTSDERRALSKAAVDRAFALEPDSPWSQFALGYYYYHGCKQYEEAWQAFAKAQQGLGEDAEILEALANVRRRQGKFEDALEYYRRAMEAAPHEIWKVFNYAETLTQVLGRFAEGVKYFDDIITRAPDLRPAYTFGSFNYIDLGDREAARRLYESCPTPAQADSDFESEYFIRLVLRDYDAAFEAASRLETELIDTQFQLLTRSDMLGAIHAFRGEHEEARALFESARAALEGRVREMPDDARTRSRLGIVYARLGRAEDAVREGKRGVELYPRSVDAYIAPSRAADLAEIHVILGDHDRAIDEMEKIVGVAPWQAMSPGRIKLHPLYDEIRDHPRLQALLRRVAQS